MSQAEQNKNFHKTNKKRIRDYRTGTDPPKGPSVAIRDHPWLKKSQARLSIYPWFSKNSRKFPKNFIFSVGYGNSDCVYNKGLVFS
ncbi:MAG: hypothetical protein Q4G69_10235 [Planctomycetia bacterium]|nr:hypothetical protein [Planctomycetia bacterium]